MNAVAPPGLKPGPRRSGTAEQEAVRLTMDYDDAPEAGQPGLAADAGADVGRKGEGGRQRKAGTRTPVEDLAGTGRGDAMGLPGVPAHFASIEVSLSVEIGSRMVPLRELMSVEPGQLFALDRMTNEPVTILVNGKAFAHGEVVAMGERFGVRLIDLLPGGSL